MSYICLHYDYGVWQALQVQKNNIAMRQLARFFQLTRLPQHYSHSLLFSLLLLLCFFLCLTAPPPLPIPFLPHLHPSTPATHHKRQRACTAELLTIGIKLPPQLPLDTLCPAHPLPPLLPGSLYTAACGAQSVRCSANFTGNDNAAGATEVRLWATLTPMPSPSPSQSPLQSPSPALTT